MKKIGIVLGCLLMSFFVSCTRGQHLTAEEQVIQAMQTMTQYTAEMDVTFTTNNKTATMKLKQVYHQDGTYEMTLLEPESLKGYQTIYNGEHIEEYHPREDKKVQAQASPVKNQVLFATFMHNYLQRETKQPLVLEGDTLTVTLDIPGNYKYMATEKVWFDCKTGKPIHRVIYDKEGKMTIDMVMTTFEYNQ